ncbi:uncharacterized protein LOC111124292 [Crassostrea virginica]
MASSIEDIARDPAETQTEQINDEEIRQRVEGLRENLTQLHRNNAYLCAGLQGREAKLARLGDYQTLLSSTMSEFLGTMSGIRKKILDYRREGAQVDQEIASLLEEKAVLKEEEHLLADRCATRLQKEGGTGPVEADLTDEEKSELRLNDYTRYDLYRKLQCLQELKDASQRLKMSYQREWSKIKDDIKKHREERKQYEMEIQSVHNTALLKLRNLHLNPADEEDQEIMQLIKYLEMKREIRELRENNLDLQVMSRDFENDIAQLRDTRRDLVKETEGLEQASRSRNPEEAGFLLHRTSRHTNLVIRDDFPEDTASLGEPDHVGGTHLHRCAKNSCIAIPKEMWNEEELEELKQLTNGMDSEESTDGSDITDDVNVDDVNIEFTEDEEEKTNTDERLVCEGLKTNLKDPKQSIDFKNHMDEMIAGNSNGLLTKLRARMGMQARSGTTLRPEVTSEDGRLRCSSLRDAAVNFISRKQRRK